MPIAVKEKHAAGSGWELSHFGPSTQPRQSPFVGATYTKAHTSLTLVGISVGDALLLSKVTEVAAHICTLRESVFPMH